MQRPIFLFSLIALLVSGCRAVTSREVLDSSSLPTEAPPTPNGTPLRKFEKIIIAHGILCTVGFLLLLPIGVLIPRYLRTRTNKWYTGHWIVQVLLAGPVIVVGCILGYQIGNNGAPNLQQDSHSGIGSFLLFVFLAQCALGVVIHWIRRFLALAEKLRFPKIFLRWMDPTYRRPFQNYFHGFTGILIIGLAYANVRTGFITEWPKYTGRGKINNAANIVWIIWVVLIPVLYFIGLIFLKKQFKQERIARAEGLNKVRQDQTSSNDIEL